MEKVGLTEKFFDIYILAQFSSFGKKKEHRNQGKRKSKNTFFLLTKSAKKAIIYKI